MNLNLDRRPTLSLDIARDPLRVLESTRPVIEAAGAVRIVPAKVAEAADRLAGTPEPPPDWSAQLHPAGRDAAELANLVLVVDALNFCFWTIPAVGKPRWRVTYGGETYDGYWALAVALRRAVEQGRPLWDGEYLVGLTEPDVAEILAGDPGSDEIPLLRARMAHLHEVGHALLTSWDGSFLRAIEHARGSAPALVKAVVHALPSFNDVTLWHRHEVRFYKRAQILIADLFGAFGGRGPGAFHDMDSLTAFADYKVPQVLRRYGILAYAPALAARIARYELLPPGSDEEVEIRAATVWGVELLRQALAERGAPLPAYAIDWALWRAGQALPPDTEPYHRTLTVFY